MPETLSPTDDAPPMSGLVELGAAVLTRLRQVLEQWRLVLQVIGLVSFANVIFYLAFVYLVDLAGQRSGNAAAANTIATVIQTAGLLLAIGGGRLADRFGMLPVNRWGNLVLLLVTPLGLLVGQRGDLIHLAIAELLLVAPLMVTMGAQGVLGVLLVPERQRCAVFSIAYSLAMALFAGTAPLVATWLAAQQWSIFTVPYCLIYGVVALFTVHRLRHASLR